MEHTPDTSLSCFHNHCSGVVFGVPCVHYHRYAQGARKLELRGERQSLLIAGRIVVVVVEPALANRNRSAYDMLLNSGDIPRKVEADCIVRMHARCVPDEPRIACRDRL